MLTDKYLLVERDHLSSFVGGTQRIYKFKDGRGLSLVNGVMLHSYPFAWEAAVLKNLDDEGNTFDLDYSTPLTDDVVVFNSDEEANAFIEKAAELFGVE